MLQKTILPISVKYRLRTCLEKKRRFREKLSLVKDFFGRDDVDSDNDDNGDNGDNDDNGGRKKWISR